MSEESDKRLAEISISIEKMISTLPVEDCLHATHQLFLTAVSLYMAVAWELRKEGWEGLFHKLMKEELKSMDLFVKKEGANFKEK